jgi:RHS repeat-associated protein
MKPWLLILLIIFSSLSGEEETFSLVNQAKSPILRVAGSVNIISGNWVDQSTHYLTTGPDPYAVAHNYISSSLEEGNLADGWDLYHPSDLEVFQPRGIQYNSKDVSCDEAMEKGARYQGVGKLGAQLPEHNRVTVFYRDAGGATVVFKSINSNETYNFAPKLKNTGYMLVSSIDNPVRRDVKRTTLNWESSSDHWIVRLGDGTRRTYSRTDKHKHRPRPNQKSYFKRLYHIKEEVLPSGNKRRYLYDSDKELSKIITLSSDEKSVIHTVAFHRTKEMVQVKTSEGITTTFSLKKLCDRDTAHVVEKIVRPGLAELRYSYTNRSFRHERRIDERGSSTGRHDVVKFYKEGKNEVGKSVVTIKGKNEKKFFENRVREIWTKSLPGQHLALSHAFTYQTDSYHSVAKVQENDGSLTTYFWDQSDRPNWIGFKNPSGQQLQAEHFVWGLDENGEEGWLKHRTLFDEQKNPVLDREFIYDDRGNVIKETVHGSFTGRSCQKLKRGRRNYVYGSEELSWTAQYSSDNRSLKTAEEGPLGYKTEYEYDSSRQLLTARFTYHNGLMLKREFFTYDAAGICIESTVDDGTSRQKDRMTDATRRMIHRVKPRYQAPFYGEPEEEQWLIFTRRFGEQILRTERYIRDDQGRAIAKELLDGHGVVQKRWTYSYDNLHRLIESCDPIGRVERFAYDDGGRISMKSTPEAAITFSYDLFDRVTEERKTFPDGTIESLCRQYDLSGRNVTEIDFRGRETTIVKDAAGRVVKKILPSLATESGDVHPEVAFQYSGTTETTISPAGAVTQITRSVAGKPLITVSPTGASTSCYYDTRNRLVEQKDSSGVVTLYEYDSWDRVVKEEQQVDGKTIDLVTKKYQGWDLIEERHSTNLLTFEYDSLGRKVAEWVTDLLTNQATTTRTRYDALHRPIQIIHENTDTSEFLAYDAADRIIERRVVGSNKELLSIATKSYDTAGRVIEEGIGRAGTIARTKTAYGAYGLPSSVTYPDGTVTKYAYNPLCRWKDGRLYFHKVVTDARGVLFEELLDSNDQARLSIVRDPNENLISSKTAIFSILGKPVLIEELAIAEGEPTTTIKTRIEYDTLGQCISLSLADGTPEAATWHYAYDTLGRKIKEIKPSGTALDSTYDAKGLLSTFKSSDGSISWSYSYNDQGLPETIVNHVTGDRTQRQYNGLGIMTHEALENDLSLSYGILPTGQLSSIDYPDGSRAVYSYTFGQLDSVAWKECTFQINSRDLSGMITDATLPSSAGHLSYSLDIMGRKTAVHHAAFSEERIAFDPIGNCVERTIDGVHEAFAYDFLCQLTSDNGRSARFDSLYRRIETEGKKASHNSRHQIVSQGDQSFMYDIDGRRARDDRFRYTYDACDRLIAVEDDSTRAEYTYDPFNRRLSSTTFTKDGIDWKAASSERYLWQGDCEIGSVNGDSPLKSLRVLGEGLGAELGAAVLYELDGQIYIPIHDLSGHVRVCLDTQNNLAEKFTYTAFGIKSRTADLSPWTFSSKRQDPLTGFLYFGRRYYDSSTATWLTQDPLGTSAGPNLYAYVRNNPLNAMDLFGLIDQAVGKGFFGDMFDKVCDFFSSLFGGWGGGAEASEASGVSMESPTPHEPESRDGPKQESVHHQSRSTPKDKNYDHVEMVGSKEDDFYRECAGKIVTILAHLNGMNTSYNEAVEQVAALLKAGGTDVKAALALYSSTHGLTGDLIRAAFTALGFELSMATTLRSGFDTFVEKCRDYHIQLVVINTSHSHGAGVSHQIFTENYIRENNDVIKRIERVNFGGSVVDPLAINYITVGDPVPALCPLNWLNAPHADVRFVMPDLYPIVSPHSFFGSGYQRAVEEFFKERNQ